MSAGSVGVLGGAFNPPHIGHLVLAQEAISELGLDQLIVVPTGEAPHKRIEPEPGAELRLQMTERAFEHLERARVTDLEVRRAGPSYSYRTLELLADEHPGSQLTFVMGADVAAGLASWRRPERVLELARVAVARRPGIDGAPAERTLAELGGSEASRTLEMPEIGVSSTMVRERVAAGKPVRWLVPPAVAELISERGLYQGEGVPA